LEHFGGQHLAHATLEGKPAVATARPGRPARALGAEIEQPPVFEVVSLCEEKAPAIAQIGIVGTELVTVIAQGKWLRQRARQGLKAPEMGKPLRIAEPIEPHASGPALVAMAQHGLREIGRRNAIEEGVAEREVILGGLE